MTKATMQKHGVLVVALVMMFVFAFASVFIATMTGSTTTANAADYSYDSSRDGANLNSDGSLTVTFDVTYGVSDWGGSMIQWVVYLFDPERNLDYDYSSYDHKYYSSEDLGRDTADYYFMTDNNTDSGTITVTIPADATAYSGGPQNAASATDYENYDTGKTLIQVLNEKNWNVSVGPFWNNGWASTGQSYNVDYFVEEAEAIIANGDYRYVATDAIAFFDYDGTALGSASDAIVLPQATPTRSGYTFDGWYCDTVMQVYTSEQVAALTVAEALNGNTHVNFYATYKKADANDYLEITSSVISVEGDYVDVDGNVGRAYASVDDMDYVYVRYDITHNPGVHNLEIVLAYDDNAFSLAYGAGETLADVISYASTALGTPDFNNIDAHKIVWDTTGDAYASLVDGFFTIRYTVNKEAVVSGRTYFFGVKIYPYVENDSAVANRIITVDNQPGEQVDVPVTQVVRSFQPVVRRVATIAIGGNEYDYADVNPSERQYVGTYNGTTFSTLQVGSLPSVSNENFDFNVRYTYNGDADVQIVWISPEDYTAYANDPTYAYTALSAPQEPGEVVVLISAPQTLNYYAVAPVACRVTITKIQRNITIEGASHVYGNTPYGLYSGSTSGITFSAYIAKDNVEVVKSSTTPVDVYDILYNLSYDAAHYTVFINGYSAAAGSGVDSGADYTVYPKPVNYTIESGYHTYGDTPAGLSYSGGVSGVTFTPYIAKNSEAVALSSATPAGEYDILYTLSATTGLGNYAVTVNGQAAYATGDTGSDYQVYQRTIYLVAHEQTKQYTGSQPTLDTGAGTYDFYKTNEFANGNKFTAEELAAIGFDSSLVYINYTGSEERVEIGEYPEAILATYGGTFENYHVSEVPGTLIIGGAGDDYFRQFFATYNHVYNGEAQVVIAGSGLPNWVTMVEIKSQYDDTYTEGVAFSKTNADTYNFTVRLTLADAIYSSANSDVVTIANDNEHPLNATIDRASVTISATSISRVYGQQPITVPSFVVEGTSEPIDHTYAIEDNGVAFTPAVDTNVGVYDIVITLGSNPNFIVTKHDGTYTVTKATPVVTVSAQDVYYNRALVYSGNAQMTEVSVTPVYTFYNNSACESQHQVLMPEDAGTYYVKASVAETANYYAASSDAAAFAILPIQLALPGVSYNGATVTLGNVTQDVGGVALKAGTVVTYTINNVAGQSYTAEGTTEGYSFVVASSNNSNYLANGDVTAAVYSVDFADNAAGHAYNSDVPANIPSVVYYAFSGEDVTISNAVPTLYGYTFAGWDAGLADNIAAGATIEDIASSMTLYADWNVVSFLVSFVCDSDTLYEANIPFGSAITYPSNVVPTKPNTQGIAYDFAEKWSYNDAEYTFTVDGETATLTGITVSGAMTFVAVFNETYGVFEITYYFSEDGSAEYVQYGEVQLVTYGDPIVYRTFDGEDYAWFVTDYWYGDADRTIAAPAVMPAEHISVYGTYKFNIGTGDVNADGKVDANDITLYRQWIVGGYAVTTVANGEEWATVTDQEFNAQGTYFLCRVADNNADAHKDIRDVSITRMAVVGGYAWDISVGGAVSGQAIARSTTAATLEAVLSILNNSGRATLYANITDAEGIISVAKSGGNLSIDLAGNTLDIRSLSLVTYGKDATISISNGIISASEGITLSAPNGNVIIENVTAYVDDAPINLQAASSSLHFAGAVEFYDGTIEDVEPVAAPINIEGGTHVVFEQTAEIVIEKVVVTQNFVAAPTAAIIINNNSAAVAEIDLEVEGVVTNEVNSLDSLKAASGSVVLTADINAGDSDVCYSSDVTIDLNGHNITFTGWGFEANNGATLTINGNGNVSAVEAALYAQRAGKLVINGGTYTSTNNFVVGTHGSAGRGGNEITINGGIFNGSIVAEGYIAGGIYVANSDTVEVNAGTFNITNGVAIIARSGNTTVGEDVVINMLGDNNISGKVGDSSKPALQSGIALVLDLVAGYPGGVPSLVNNSEYEVVTVNAQ